MLCKKYGLTTAAIISQSSNHSVTPFIRRPTSRNAMAISASSHVVNEAAKIVGPRFCERSIPGGGGGSSIALCNSLIRN